MTDPQHDTELITVAICTLNRADAVDLCKTLLSISSTDSDVEVLVVNNGPDESLKPSFTALNDISYVYEPVAGLSRARNIAMQVARGQYVLFLDDDVVIEPAGYLAAVKNVLRNLKPDILGGPVDPVFDTPPPVWLPLEYVSRIKTERSNWMPAGAVSGGNFAIRKALFDDIGGFRIDLGMDGDAMGFLEEFEFVLRYRMHPARRCAGIYYSHECRIGHKNPSEKIRFSYLMARAFKSHRQKGQLFAKLASGRRRCGFRLACLIFALWSALAGLFAIPKSTVKGGIRRSTAAYLFNITGRVGLVIGSMFHGSANDEPRTKQSTRQLRATIIKPVSPPANQAFPDLIDIEDFSSRFPVALGDRIDLWAYRTIVFEMLPDIRTLLRIALDQPGLTVVAPINGPAGKFLLYSGLVNAPLEH